MEGGGSSGECTHSWPDLEPMFQFSERIKDSFRFKRLICLPKTNHITAYKNLPSNLRRHIESQLEAYRCENERLRAGETAALSSMRQNAQVASKYLIKAAQDAETSIKQLLTGRETLCLVSELLSSIDKITEIPK